MAAQTTRVVVIGAHPDDEILGAGGCLARHVLLGHEVHAVVVADGAGSRYPAEMMATLENDARRAAGRAPATARCCGSGPRAWG